MAPSPPPAGARHYDTSQLQTRASSSRSGSSETLANNDDNAETPMPARLSRSAITSRARGDSRSSSAPAPAPAPLPTDLSVLRTRPSNAPTEPSALRKPTRNSESNVRHMTCVFWAEKGHCKFSQEECAYAHYHTGRKSDLPRQLVPGEPAKAGRNLERSMTSMSHKNAFTRHSSATHQSSASVSGMQPWSRPTTPLASAPAFKKSFELNTPSSTPSPRAVTPLDTNLISDLLEQSNRREKVLLSMNERLDDENKNIRGVLQERNDENDRLGEENTAILANFEALRIEHENLRQEAAGLRYRIAQISVLQQASRNERSLNRTPQEENPYGAIGTRRGRD